MFRNYFLAALRNARKFRIRAAINILGLSVALAGGLALAVALLTISLHSLRAAGANPFSSLCKE